MVSYSCAGGPATLLPPGFSFKVSVSGNPADPDATFVQNNFGACVNTEVGKVACDGEYMNLPAFKSVPGGPPQCAPANCLGNNQCSQVPAPIEYTYEVATVNGVKQLTTVTLPNTPLTTCTAQNKQNPITFVWTAN